MHENILIATDGASRTRTAIERGIEVAQRDGATVHALYVIDLSNADVDYYPGDTGLKLTGGSRKKGGDRPPPDSPLYRLRVAGEEATRAVIDLADESDVDAVGAIMTDKPHQAILDYARENDIDLIVIGTGGSTGLKRAIWGGTASNVYENADVPVLVCNPDGSKRQLSADDVPADLPEHDDGNHEELTTDDRTVLSTDESDDTPTDGDH
jgi:nucleotide-binding universal stress UspA family protein